MASASNRSVWSGSVQVGLLSLPIKLHTAIREHDPDFNMVSPKGGMVGYKYYDKLTGEEVNRAECKKGFRFGDQMIVIDPEEIGRLLPKSTRTVEIYGFAKAEQVDWLYLSTPLFVSPNTDVKKGGSLSVKAYHLLRKILELTNTVAFGSFVKNNKQNLLVLRPYRGVLVLQTLWWYDEVREVPEVEQAEISEKERELMQMLLEKMAIELKLDDYQDDYAKKVTELLTARALNQEIEIEREVETETDLMKALEQSVGGINPKKKVGVAITTQGDENLVVA